MKYFTLTISQGECKGKSFEVDAFPLEVGRNVEHGISVQDSAIDDRHFQMKRLDDVFVLEDLDSTSGTYLNGERIYRAQVCHEDRILIGNTEIVLRHVDVKQKSIPRDNHHLSFLDGVMSMGMSPVQDAALQKHKIRWESGSHYAPQIVDMYSNIDQLALQSTMPEEIFSCTGDFIVKDNLEDTCHILLHDLARKMPQLKKAVMLFYQEDSGNFTPGASIHFDKNSTVFIMHKHVIRDILLYKKPLWLSAKDHDHPCRWDRMIIPILSRNRVIGMVHFESDCKQTSVKQQEAAWAYAQALLSRGSVYLEMFLLRNEIDAWTWACVNALLVALEAKDTYTVGHSERVCRYAMCIADELGLKRELKKDLMISALLHDIGKIGTPDYILKNSTPLTYEKYEEIKLHPDMGDKIIRHLPNYEKIYEGVKYHHERKDGTGYPEGLVGDDIPFLGRLVAVADCFDAMISGRSYSGFMDEEDAIVKLLGDTHAFDEDILHALARAYERGTLSLRTGTQKKDMVRVS